MKINATFFIIILLFTTNASATETLFGKTEDRNNDIEEFPKWMTVLSKKKEEAVNYKEKCAVGSKVFYCNIDEWVSFLENQNKRSKLEQLTEVNRFANNKKYILDIDNWGETDYWASPGEFLFKNGDCEDYAIIKYFSLKQLGFDADSLRVVVLFDNNLQIYHSVLAVYLDGQTYILDNQISNITESSKILHYNPVYSINEDHWWRYL